MATDVKAQSPAKASGQSQAGPASDSAAAKGKSNIGVFAKEMVMNPTVVGAIAPSGSALAREMIAGVDLSDVSTVVEYGPGAGAFTRGILAAMPKTARYFAIELSPVMADRFTQHFPDARLYVGSAADVPELCRLEGLNGHTCVDAIFSGLPFASFGEDLQTKILERTVQVLRPQGSFHTFAYAGFSSLTPAGRRFRRLLHKHFSKVTMSKIIWKNLPPAFVFKCVK